MVRLALSALLLLLISSFRVSGQLDGGGKGIFSGTIVDDSLGFAIPSVHLWNESTRMGSVSNAYGEFKIRAGDQDTIVFSAIGYYSEVILALADPNGGVVVRLKQKIYEIDELVVRRFHSYESFIYQVVHHELPESEISEMKGHMDITLNLAAVEADRERNAREKMINPGFSTALGPHEDPNKAFREKVWRMEKRKRVIRAKFNREMVAEITHLEEEDLTAFIALCNFSEDYLFKTELPAIIEDIYAVLDDFQSRRDTILPDLLQ
jgi:hypothetical protein